MSVLPLLRKGGGGGGAVSLSGFPTYTKTNTPSSNLTRIENPQLI